MIYGFALCYVSHGWKSKREREVRKFGLSQSVLLIQWKLVDEETENVKVLHWRSKRTQAFTVSLWLAAIMWPTFLGLVIWLIFDIRTHQTKLIWLVYRGTKSKPCNKFKRCLNNTQHLTLLTVRFVRKTHLTKIVSFYWYVFKQCHLFKGISHFMWSIPRRQQDNSNRNEKKKQI